MSFFFVAETKHALTTTSSNFAVRGPRSTRPYPCLGRRSFAAASSRASARRQYMASQLPRSRQRGPSGCALRVSQSVIHCCAVILLGATCLPVSPSRISRRSSFAARPSALKGRRKALAIDAVAQAPGRPRAIRPGLQVRRCFRTQKWKFTPSLPMSSVKVWL